MRVGNPGHKGANQHTKARAVEVRAGLLMQLEGATGDLKKLLEAAREYGDDVDVDDKGRARCKACGAFIPGVTRLKLSDILSVIGALQRLLPAQVEHEGMPPIQVNVVAGVQVQPNPMPLESP